MLRILAIFAIINSIFHNYIILFYRFCDDRKIIETIVRARSPILFVASIFARSIKYLRRRSYCGIAKFEILLSKPADTLVLANWSTYPLSARCTSLYIRSRKIKSVITVKRIFQLLFNRLRFTNGNRDNKCKRQIFFNCDYTALNNQFEENYFIAL